jgi:hypothetical protein
MSSQSGSQSGHVVSTLDELISGRALRKSVSQTKQSGLSDQVADRRRCQQCELEALLEERRAVVQALDIVSVAEQELQRRLSGAEKK